MSRNAKIALSEGSAAGFRGINLLYSEWEAEFVVTLKDSGPEACLALPLYLKDLTREPGSIHAQRYVQHRSVFREVLAADEADWSFWLDYYEGWQEGRLPDRALILEIATTAEIDWDDPIAANAKIVEIWKRF